MEPTNTDAQSEAFSTFAESLTIGEQVMYTTITGAGLDADPDPGLMMRALATIALQRLAQPGDTAITPSVADGLTMADALDVIEAASRAEPPRDAALTGILARIRPHAPSQAAAIEATAPFRETDGGHGRLGNHHVSP